MIHDFLIIRDGLPLLVKNYSNVHHLFSQGDNLLMITGFFSALNSFSDSFEDLGTISELKLSNNDLKLSFLRDTNIPSLIYLATFDAKSKLSNIQNLLQIIAKNFLKEFNIKQILSWNGKIDNFNSFDSIINQHIESENKKIIVDTLVNKIELLENKLDETVDVRETNENNAEQEKVEAIPHYYKLIPYLTSSKKINPKLFLTGESSCEIYDQVDGTKSINQISQKLELTQERVYNICKNLIKMGFISFSD